MSVKPPRILVIAGSDSSGGAGISRDVVTAAAFGVEVCPVLTAVTAQTDQAVTALHPVPPEVVAAQIKAARTHSDIAAIKIGMLGSAEVAEVVGRVLVGSKLPLVIDPVLRASSGGRLSEGSHLPALFSGADLLTPNLPEAAVLTGLPEAVTPQEI
ncbi:bifunctional hydroxymethylpyrimidine kinase/phosphomethylpyrimidine kinase, partial [Aliiroseovarius crassostreae]|uniref:bifunctional hydroxymethylpyrimidine kinase/phosphomethylpyrimidine kinase n=1 Tax=Aliiroseovarius crassostreae TaxID=154981 RepID=UPI003C7D28BA